MLSYHAYAKGIVINEVMYKNETSIVSPFCIDDQLKFSLSLDASIAEYIDYVYWDMGDGITEKRAPFASFLYAYESPQLHNIVSATIFYKEDSPFSATQIPISVSFDIVIPDTIHVPLVICNEQPIQWEDTITSIGGWYTFTKTGTLLLRGDDCTKIAQITVTEGETTYSEEYLSVHDSCEWRGKKYYDSGIYTDTITNVAGCDSILKLHLEVIHCLKISDIQIAFESICQDEGLFIPYTKNPRGQIIRADLVVNNHVLTANQIEEDVIHIEMSQLLPSEYDGTLYLYDGICLENQYAYPIHFMVYYSSGIFKQKWDHVWAIYNEEHNGGYKFTAFQWYRNGEPIVGATKSWYDNGHPFNPDDVYTVLLTRNDGKSQFSCPKNAIIVLDENNNNNSDNNTDNSPESSKKVISRTWYNCMGLLVTECKDNKMPELTSGIYIVHICYDNGEEESNRVVIP